MPTGRHARRERWTDPAPDSVGTVLMYRFGSAGYEPEREPTQLAWLLNGAVPELA